MAVSVSADSQGPTVRVPRSLRSRLLGSTFVPCPLLCGVALSLIVVNGVFEGTPDGAPEDRLSPSGFVLTIALLALMAVTGLVLGVAEWRRSVVLGHAGVEVHTGWRRRCVPWADLDAIEFCQIPMMYPGTTPAAELVRRDGTRVELRALAHAGRRMRQRQVDVLAAASARHGVEVRSDGSWWWHRIDLAGRPGGLRRRTTRTSPAGSATSATAR